MSSKNKKVKEVYYSEESEIEESEIEEFMVSESERLKLSNIINEMNRKEQEELYNFILELDKNYVSVKNNGAYIYCQKMNEGDFNKFKKYIKKYKKN